MGQHATRTPCSNPGLPTMMFSCRETPPQPGDLIAPVKYQRCFSCAAPEYDKSGIEEELKRYGVTDADWQTVNSELARPLSTFGMMVGITSGIIGTILGILHAVIQVNGGVWGIMGANTFPGLI